MDRLTKKIENPQYSNDYEMLCSHDYHVLNKLGKLEDLFDSYSVEDLQELDKLLGMATAYEELSKQIGYPLEVLINAQVNGFYGQIGEKTVFYNPNKDFIVIDFNLQRLQVALNGDFYNGVTFYFDDYKKTFWLKEDKGE